MDTPEPHDGPDPLGGAYSRSPSASGTARAPEPTGEGEGTGAFEAVSRPDTGAYRAVSRRDLPEDPFADDPFDDPFSDVGPLTDSGEFGPLGDSGEFSLPSEKHQSGEFVPPPGTFPPGGTHRSGEFAPPPATGRFDAAGPPATGHHDAVAPATGRYDGSGRQDARSERYHRAPDKRESSRERRSRRSRRRSRHSRRGSDRGRLTKIGPYRLLKRLGKGSHGYVYLARREGEKQEVALKILRARMLKYKDALERFKREAELARKLRHPGVLQVIDSGQEGDQLWYAMEYCSGHTLQAYLQRLPMDPDKARKLVAKLARTVAYAHEQGVIHRDIKPSNILLDPESGHPRITDFGLAKDRWEDSELTQAGEQIGTPIYMSPEQFRGQDVDHRADIYSLGVVLYECLTGRPPYEAQTTPEVAKLVLAGNPVHPTANVPGVSQELEAICLKAMSKEWVGRYAKASELADALEAAVGHADDEKPRGVGMVPLVITMTFVGLAAGIVGWSWLGTAGKPHPSRPESPTPSPSLDSPPVQTPPPLSGKAERDRRAQEKLEHARELSLAELPFDQNLAAYDEAVALAQHDDGLRAQAELARTEYLFRRGRLERCNRAAAVLAQRRGDVGFQARYFEAMSDLLRGQQGARERLEKLWKEDADGAPGITAGAVVSLRAGDAPRAEELANQALRKDPQSAEAWIALAASFVAQKRFNQGLQALEQALEQRPDHPQAYMIRAQALLGLSRLDQAYAAYSRVIALTEPKPLLAALRARVKLGCQLGKTRPAILDALRLVERDPLDVEARLWAGVAYDQAGKRDKALSHWQIAADVDRKKFESLLQKFDTRTAVRIRAAVLGDD